MRRKRHLIRTIDWSTGQRAFSLMELVSVVLISSLVVGAALSLRSEPGITDECFLKTRDQLNGIQTAIQQFVTKNDRYPMPAKRGIGVDNPDFGREATAIDLTVISSVTYGALPFQALGLPTEYAADCWDNKFTYAVTTALTTDNVAGGYLDALVNGAIVIKSDASNTLMTDAAYAVISHGPDGLGAVKRNATAAGWCSASADLRTANCDANDAILVVAQFNAGKDAGAVYFDDIVVFKGRTPVVSSGGCTAPWGDPVADGGSVFAYSTPSAPDCVAVRETRNCAAGVLSGSYIEETCTIICSAPSCDGSLIAPGCHDACFIDGTNLASVGFSMFAGYICTSGVWVEYGGMGGPYNFPCP